MRHLTRALRPWILDLEERELVMLFSVSLENSTCLLSFPPPPLKKKKNYSYWSPMTDIFPEPDTPLVFLSGSVCDRLGGLIEDKR